MDEVIKDAGEENGVQIVTNNVANYVVVEKFLMERQPHIFWTHCVVHCIDLMLEDLGKLPWIKILQSKEGEYANSYIIIHGFSTS